MKNQQFINGHGALVLVAIGLLLVIAHAIAYPVNISPNTQEAIEARAMSLPEKDCYTWQEIETIIFGEIQE